MLGITFVHPAAAQVSFGSPADPPRVALGGGAFDVLPDNKKPGSGATGLVLSEYRFGDLLWIVAYSSASWAPAKAPSTVRRLRPTSISSTNGLSLRQLRSAISPWQRIDIDWRIFRTGAEFDYRCDNLVRLGVGLYHISNAGIGKQNPGVEMATFVFTVPLR
jgi:hypothetical protein